ncbi:hypothetical protein Trydic_g21211 [Trypoxylus dichotomus]
MSPLSCARPHLIRLTSRSRNCTRYQHEGFPVGSSSQVKEEVAIVECLNALLNLWVALRKLGLLKPLNIPSPVCRSHSTSTLSACGDLDYTGHAYSPVEKHSVITVVLRTSRLEPHLLFAKHLSSVMPGYTGLSVCSRIPPSHTTFSSCLASRVWGLNEATWVFEGFGFTELLL